MMKTTNNVTLPTAATLKDMPIPLSYYAQLLGARSVYNTNIVNEELTAIYGDKSYEFGEVWLGTLGDSTLAAATCSSAYLHGMPSIPADWNNNIKNVQTYTWRDKHDGGARLHERDVFNRHVAVLPCFNASEDGFDVRLVEGENLLTFKGKVAFYPQSPIDAAIGKELDRAYNLWETNEQLLPSRKHAATMSLVGGYSRPVYFDYAQEKYQMQRDLCFNYQGKNYVRALREDGTYEWLNCEPVKAFKTADNQVLPQQALFASSFDQPEKYYDANYPTTDKNLNVQHYALGEFMNNELTADLAHSTTFSEQLLTQPKARFGRGLKGKNATNEHNR